MFRSVHFNPVFSTKLDNQINSLQNNFVQTRPDFKIKNKHKKNIKINSTSVGDWTYEGANFNLEPFQQELGLWVLVSNSNVT